MWTSGGGGRGSFCTWTKHTHPHATYIRHLCKTYICQNLSLYNAYQSSLGSSHRSSIISLFSFSGLPFGSSCVPVLLLTPCEISHIQPAFKRAGNHRETIGRCPGFWFKLATMQWHLLECRWPWWLVHNTHVKSSHTFPQTLKTTRCTHGMCVVIPCLCSIVTVTTDYQSFQVPSECQVAVFAHDFGLIALFQNLAHFIELLVLVQPYSFGSSQDSRLRTLLWGWSGPQLRLWD